MTDHYDKLGVDKTATDADIKRAYRQKARTAHPDKGGDKADFAELANAYEVLKDPQRRLLYDRTGQDEERGPLETAVRNELLNAFRAVLGLTKEGVNVLATVRNMFKNELHKTTEKQGEILRHKNRVQRKRGKITTTATINVVELILDKELLCIEADLANQQYQKELFEACLEELETYSQEVEQPNSESLNRYFNQFQFTFKP